MNALPQVFLKKYGHLRHITKRGRSEWSAECPECRDYGHVGTDKPDRFRLFSDGRPRVWCRSCGLFSFVDDSYGQQLSKEELEEIRLERTRLANIERDRIRTKIDALEQQAAWVAYHEAMEVQHRQLWRKAGISDEAQDWWVLGYNSELEYPWEDGVKKSPALTIPYWQESHVVNLQQRLLQPANPSDKYRFAPGLPAPAYLPDKDELPTGKTLVVEGAKKAMVAWLHLGGSYTIVGLPSKYMSRLQQDVLADCDPIILALDPDAKKEAERNGQALKKDGKDVFIASLPAKIDDLIVVHEFCADDVRRYINDARRV